MAEKVKCAHYEKLEKVEEATIGTCLFCGQVKRYTWRGGPKAVIIKEGDRAKANVEGYMKALKQQIPLPEEKEEKEELVPAAKERESHKRYEENKEAIIACLLEKGRVATKKECNIPDGSMGRLISRWLTEEQRAQVKALGHRKRITKTTEQPAKPEAPRKTKAESGPVDLKRFINALAQPLESIESRAITGIIADLKELRTEILEQNRGQAVIPFKPSRWHLIEKKMGFIAENLNTLWEYIDKEG